MKITKIDAFQVAWAPTDKPAQRSAFIEVHTDDGLIGIGEASPMQGGLASLSMIKHDIAPLLIGQDPQALREMKDLIARAFGASLAVTLFLAILGALGARAGKAPMLRPVVRVTFWGAFAMAATIAIGSLLGTAVG